MLVAHCLFLVLTLRSAISTHQFNGNKDLADYHTISPRPPRFSFGLGKRSASPHIRPEVARLLATIKGWGHAGPHGLFKRPSHDSARPRLASVRDWNQAWQAGPYGLFTHSVWPLVDGLRVLADISSEVGHLEPQDMRSYTLPEMRSLMRDQMGFSMIGSGLSWNQALSPEDQDLEGATGLEEEDMEEEDMADEDMQEEDIEEDMEEDGELKGKRSSASLDGKRPYGFGLGKRSSSGLQHVLEGTDRRDQAKRALYSLYGKRGFLGSRWE